MPGIGAFVRADGSLDDVSFWSEILDEPELQLLTPVAPGRRDRRTAALLAAWDPEEHPRDDDDTARILDRLTGLRQQLGTRLLAAAEQAYEAALRQAGVKIQTRARGRTGKQRQAEVAAAVKARAPLAPLLAVVGITDLELLRNSFDTFATQARSELARYAERVAAAVKGTGVTVPSFDVDGAVEVLVTGLTAMARRRLLLGDEAMLAALPVMVPRARKAPAGGGYDLPGLPNPDELAAAGARLVRNAIGVVEGRATYRLPSTPDGLPEVVVSDATRTIEEELLVTLNVTPVWTWKHAFYGEPKTPFDPHDQLDGEDFTDRDGDERLVNDLVWPDTDTFYPGDHDWCTCEWVPNPMPEAFVPREERYVAGPRTPRLPHGEMPFPPPPAGGFLRDEVAESALRNAADQLARKWLVSHLRSGQDLTTTRRLMEKFLTQGWAPDVLARALAKIEGNLLSEVALDMALRSL